MTAARSSQRMVMLANGGVLALGGTGDIYGSVGLASCEIYNPTTNTWSATGSMATSRLSGHRAVRLPSGRILVAGGATPNPSCTRPVGCSTIITIASSEIYNPSTGTWTPGPDMPVPREEFDMVALPNGLVFATGGYARSTTGTPGGGTNYQSSLLFSEKTGAWSATAFLVVPPGERLFDASLAVLFRL